jgi:hypothetical protein
MVIDDYRRNDQADLRETEQRVNRFLKPYFGHMRATEFSTKALDDYIKARQQLGRKNATINRELAHLRRAFRLGHQNDPQLVFRLPVIKYRLILGELSEEIKSVFVVTYHLRNANRGAVGDQAYRRP